MEPGAAGSRSKYANHRSMPPPPLPEDALVFGLELQSGSQKHN